MDSSEYLGIPAILQRSDWNRVLNFDTVERLKMCDGSTRRVVPVNINPKHTNEDHRFSAWFFDVERNWHERFFFDSFEAFINIRPSSGALAGQLLVSFLYFHPQNGLEKKPREVLVEDFKFGVHPNHQGEHPDIYLVGRDNQYPAGQGERHFPLWRIARAYGDPEELAGKYLFNAGREEAKVK